MFSPAISLAARARCFGCRGTGDWLCSTCGAALVLPRRFETIPGVDRIHAPWHYEGTARDLVLALKLRARRPAAMALAEATARSIQAAGTEAEVVTWVPGRRRDIRLRGFDHAELIAREIGARIGLPVVRLLERAMDRPDQTTLSSQARWTNLEGAFTPRGDARAVMLVDDLVTTGATAAACAAALKGRSTSCVEVAVPCRA